MTTLIMFHEVENAENWANSWKKGEGIKPELFGKIGVRVRTFRDPNNPNATGVFVEVPNIEAFDEFMASDEVKQAMAEDGLKVETMRVMEEFTKE